MLLSHEDNVTDWRLFDSPGRGRDCTKIAICGSQTKEGRRTSLVSLHFGRMRDSHICQFTFDENAQLIKVYYQSNQDLLGETRIDANTKKELSPFVIFAGRFLEILFPVIDGLDKHPMLFTFAD